MIKVNLLPDEQKNEIKQAKKNTEVVNIFIKTIFILIISIIVISGIYFYYQNQVNAKSKTLSQKELEIEKYGDLQNTSQKVSDRINTIYKIESNSFKWSGLIEEINKVIPNGVYLNGFKIDSNTKVRGQITGYALSKTEVASLQDALEKSKLFKYVDIETSQTQADPSNGIERESFTITLTLEKEALNE